MKNRKKCEKRAYTRIKREGIFKVSVVGIITTQNNIIEIEEKIQSYKINEKNIIIITKENVSNIKNVKTTLIAVILITTGAGIINLLQSIYTGG